MNEVSPKGGYYLAALNVGSWSKEPAMQQAQEQRVQSLSQDDPLEKGMATHSINLAWRIPWTEEPGGLQSQRVRHD